jgi:hypothetical protein
MKRTLILTMLVLILSLSVCTGTSAVLGHIIEETRYLHNEAVRCVENNDTEKAAEIMVQLATLWREKEPFLEMITSHDAIHEVKLGIIEAQICLECGDHDDFLRTISIAGEGLEHMDSVESLSLSNLY